MRKKLYSLLFALIAGMSIVNAEDCYTGGFCYNLNRSSMTATVTYRGDTYSSYTDEYSGAVRVYKTVYYRDEYYTITAIGDWAFAGCTGITSVSLSSTIEKIGEEAFYNCKELPSIVIPGNVMIIGERAFYSCKSLQSVTISEGVKSIGERAFESCPISSVAIPASITSIGEAPFMGCTSLIGIEVSEENDRYTSRDGVLFNLSGTTLIQYPGGKQGAYTIPDGVYTIGKAAFADCLGLNSVTIPSTVAYIEKYAFDNCEAIDTITNYAATPQVIDANVFGYKNLSACTLCVPEESVNAYKTAEVWKNFGKIIGVKVPEEDMTAIENVSQAQDKSRKFIRNGLLVIEKGGKTYSVSGAEVE